MWESSRTSVYHHQHKRQHSVTCSIRVRVRTYATWRVCARARRYLWLGPGMVGESFNSHWDIAVMATPPTHTLANAGQPIAAMSLLHHNHSLPLHVHTYSVHLSNSEMDEACNSWSRMSMCVVCECIMFMRAVQRSARVRRLYIKDFSTASANALHTLQFVAANKLFSHKGWICRFHRAPAEVLLFEP